jgi:excisionase family DNA binding protein
MDSIRTSEVEGTAGARTVLLRTKQAAKMLGVTEGTLCVWRCVKRYPLRYVKVGRAIRYRVSDVEDFLRMRTESGVDAPPAQRRRRSAN